jgi:hypothetical protein
MNPAMDDLFVMLSSMASIFIAGLFMGLSWVVYKRAEAEGTILWTDLGRTLLLVSACLVAQGIVVASVNTFSEKTFKALWLVVFSLFIITGLLVARYCYRTNKLLEQLLGGGDE